MEIQFNPIQMFENRTTFSPTATSGLQPTFMGKVMTFFALAILVSAGGIFLTMQYAIQYFVNYPALMFLVFIVELALVFTSRFWSRKKGLNYALFALFALCTGVTVAPLIALVAASPAGVIILGKALLATGLVFTATALIGWTTQMNLSWMGGFLLMGLLGLIIVGIIGFFIPWGSTGEIVYSIIGILIFSGYTMYEFQMLKRFPEDMYIEAAMAIYLNIFNLFIFILRLLLALNNRN